MKRLIVVVFGLLAMFARPALAQAPHQDSKPASFHISEALVVGTTTLKPGDYKFQCKMIDGKDYLVVTSVEERAEVVRVPCTPEAIASVSTSNQFLSRSGIDGSRELTAVRIKGETIEHRLVVQPL